MNLINCVIRVLELPKIKLYKNEITCATFSVEFASARKNSSISIMTGKIYGNLVYDFLKYYDINDYVIVEAYFSLFDFENNQLTKENGINLHIVRLYPFIIQNLDY